MKKTYEKLFLDLIFLGNLNDVMFGSQNGDNYDYDDFIVGWGYDSEIKRKKEYSFRAYSRFGDMRRVRFGDYACGGVFP